MPQALAVKRAPQRGDLAVDESGALGLVTENERRATTFPCRACAGLGIGDQCKCPERWEVVAVVGIHLSAATAAIGSPWASRQPVIVGRLHNALLGYGNLPDCRPEVAAAFCEMVKWEHQ